MSNQKNLAVIKEETIDAVTAKIHSYQKSNTLHLPADYSAENALKSAWLILQNTVDKDKAPVLQVCTKESVINSLLDMVVQGLNPAKKQGYFIAYGKQLAFQRSYFGTMAVTMQVDEKIQDIIPEIVYEGDKFKYKINRGKKEIVEHEQDIDNVDNKKIRAAYCLIINQDGEVSKTEVMTFDQIKQAWAQSQMRPIDDKGNVKAGSTHDKFTAEMCKKTVINRACKPIINSSSDSHLFKQSFNRSSEIAAEEEAAREIAEHANSETLDIEAEVISETPAEQPPSPEPKKPEPEKSQEFEWPDPDLPATGTDGPSF